MGKTIVITGAGAGLGLHLARRFASEGDAVVVLGRTFAKVKAAADAIGPAALAPPSPRSPPAMRRSTC